MDKNKFLVYVAATHMLLSMMLMVIQSRKRRQHTPPYKISYAPIDERDRMRIEYLTKKVWKDDVTCVNMLRLKRESFIFVNFLGTVTYCKTLYMCVLRSRLQCF
jgi:hypothetical protein